jgi:spore germination protein KC
MIKKIPKIILLLLCMSLLSGCWDNKELNKVAVVMGVGIDKTKDNQYKITAQVIKPSSKGDGGSTSGGGSEIPTWSLSAKGKTTLDAIHNLNRISPRRLYFAHMQLLIIGEELAKSGVSDVLTWFQRDRDSRSGTLIIMTKGRAEDLLNHKIELGNIPSKAMSNLLRSSDLRQLAARKTTLRDFISELVTPGIDPSVDVITPQKIRGKIETYHLDGVGIFKNDKFMGYISSENSLAEEFVFNKFKNGVLTVRCPNKAQKKYLSFLVTDFESKAKPSLTNDQVTYNIKIFMEGDLSDQTCTEDLLKPKIKKQVEKEITNHVKNMIYKTFADSSELKVDLYGIGRDVRRYYPAYWRKNAEKWDTILPTVKLNMKVSTHIRRFGLTMNPNITKVK